MKPPTLLRLAQAGFALTAALWLWIGTLTVARVFAARPDQAALGLVLAGLMLGNLVALGLAGYGLGRGGRLAYGWAVLTAAVNFVLTLTDQVGVWDLVSLALSGGLLGLLIAKRAVFLRPR